MSCGIASLFFVLGADLCWDGESFTLVFFELFDIVDLNRDLKHRSNFSAAQYVSCGMGEPLSLVFFELTI